MTNPLRHRALRGTGPAAGRTSHRSSTRAALGSAAGFVLVVAALSAVGPRLAGATYAYGQGYDFVGGDGGVITEGNAVYYNSIPGEWTSITHPTTPIVSATAMPTLTGYWMTTSTGGVWHFGSAQNHTSLWGRHITPAKPISGMTATVTGNGYWLVGQDGGVFSFNAAYHGSLPSIGATPKGPVVGIVADPSGGGYWVFTTYGWIWDFGNACSCGSLLSEHITPAKPISGMAAMPTGNGYWLVGQDGGVFTFGTAPFDGNAHDALPQPFVGIEATADGKGYWLVSSDGAIFAFGDAHWLGGHATSPLAKPIVSFAAPPA